jgi:phytoene dehydrogenase-like protein
MRQERTLEIAIVGSGISGLSAAWLLSQRHRVTLFEADGRIGGHSHTVMVGDTPVDTGFIVYNEQTYPNLTALFAHLEVPTQPAEMSFAVSLDDGRLEYAGTDLGGLFAQKRNLVSPRFWSMLRDLERFYRCAPRDLPLLGISRWAPISTAWLRRGFSGGSPLSHGRRHLVDPGARHSIPSRRCLYPLLREPRPAQAGPAPAMAHRDGRQPRLCAAADRIFRRPYRYRPTGPAHPAQR